MARIVSRFTYLAGFFLYVFPAQAQSTASYQQTFVNIASSAANAHGSSVYVVPSSSGSGTYAFFYQVQPVGACVPTSPGLYAFYLGGQLSNYFYVQNCDGAWAE